MLRHCNHHLHCTPAEVFGWLGDGGKWRVAKGCERYVIETRYGYLLRNMQAGLADTVYRANGHFVVFAEDRRRAVRLREQ